MESKFMKINGVGHGYKRWEGKDSKPYGSWRKKLREASALCARESYYMELAGKKVLPRHDLDPAHKAAGGALQHTTLLPGATTTADLPASITDRVCDLKIRVRTLIAEHDLSFRLTQPLVN